VAEDGSDRFHLQTAQEWFKVLAALAPSLDAAALQADALQYVVLLTYEACFNVTQVQLQWQYRRQTAYENILLQCEQLYVQQLASHGQAAAEAVLLPGAYLAAVNAAQAGGAAAAAVGGMAAAGAAPGAAGYAGGGHAGLEAAGVDQQLGEDQAVHVHGEEEQQQQQQEEEGEDEIPPEERIREVEQLPVFMPANKRKQQQRPRQSRTKQKTSGSSSKSAPSVAAATTAALLADVQVSSTCKPRGVHAAAAPAAAAAAAARSTGSRSSRSNSSPRGCSA
jgi:hypothetical protein